ncbi:MAG: hypothetical protein JOZ72_14075 [Alphaproteobacteria bacterium]|nr:hypothetical protein [Alphaproteobacteria bacterium]
MRIAYLALAAAMLSGAQASAATFTTLHKFCSKVPCEDGAGPLESPLISDGAGGFYGTTQNFGGQNGGTLYLIAADGKFKKLFDFPAIASPRGPLLRDTSDNLYGIESNGNSGSGGIFRLHPNAKRTKWSFEQIYSFCAEGGNCADGNVPVELTYEGAASGVPYDGISPLYGSTQFGGTSGNGAIFQLTPKRGGWGEKVVYSFCAQTNCADGQWPAYALFFGAGAKLYGVTTAGGTAGLGTVFALTPNAKRSKWTEAVVYSFCAQESCTDGNQPSGLTMDGNGNLVGTASAGGDAQLGTLFRITPGGQFTRLYSFCAQPNCADGSGPLASPTVGADGTIYGVTSLDPRVYAFNPQSSTYSVLHTFCTDQKCSDGFEPLSPLTQDAGGRLLGTTAFGGTKHSGGTVFALVP